MQHSTPANQYDSHRQDHPEVLIDTKKTFTIVVIIWAAFVAEGTGLDWTGLDCTAGQHFGNSRDMGAWALQPKNSVQVSTGVKAEAKKLWQDIRTQCISPLTWGFVILQKQPVFHGP